MTDETQATIPVSRNVTLTLDLSDVLNASGWDDEPDGVRERLVSEMARQLLRDRSEYRDIVADELKTAVQEQVAALVQSKLVAPVQPTDGFGNAKGPQTTLSEQIATEATNWLNAQSGDYNRRETRLQKFLREEVDKVMQAELRKAIEAARAQVLERVKANAAAVIADTITRTAAGR